MALSKDMEGTVLDRSDFCSFKLMEALIRSLFIKLNSLIHPQDSIDEEVGDEYEYCPHCYANLTLQAGYSPELSHWTCKGCGMLLVNPEVPGDDDDTYWICDQCGALLNEQDSFTEEKGEWTCTECGYLNKIDASEIYATEAEYQASLKNPYKGLSDEAVLELSKYEDGSNIDGHIDVWLVRNRETDEFFAKKLLSTYDISVYSYLKDHPVAHMPRIIEFYEGDNCLVVIEEYISGRTVDDIMDDEQMTPNLAISIAKQLCAILDELHNLPTPIVHRDVKPSNIFVTGDDEVYLLDMNIAKWYDPEKIDDTYHMGTPYYAAPEQAGYGMRASSAKSDIYAVGILLNVMLTGKLPKEQMPEGPIRDVITRCINLEADGRYTARELIEALEAI